jgi:hypothetical protein
MSLRFRIALGLLKEVWGLIMSHESAKLRMEAIAAAKQASAEAADTAVMKLVACDVAAGANTPETAAGRRCIDKDHPLWSPAFEAVCRAVDREMAHRDHLERLTKAATALYMEGNWRATNVSDVRAVELWTALRDALELAPGTASAAGVGAPDVVK